MRLYKQQHTTATLPTTSTSTTITATTLTIATATRPMSFDVLNPEL